MERHDMILSIKVSKVNLHRKTREEDNGGAYPPVPMQSCTMMRW